MQHEENKKQAAGVVLVGSFACQVRRYASSSHPLGVVQLGVVFRVLSLHVVSCLWATLGGSSEDLFLEDPTAANDSVLPPH